MNIEKLIGIELKDFKSEPVKFVINLAVTVYILL